MAYAASDVSSLDLYCWKAASRRRPAKLERVRSSDLAIALSSFFSFGSTTTWMVVAITGPDYMCY